MSLLYHAYVYLEFLILACTIYILAPIVLVPDYVLVNLKIDNIAPTMFILTEDCSKDIKNNCEKRKPLLGTYYTHELSQELIKKQWEKIWLSKRTNDFEFEAVKVVLCQDLVQVKIRNFSLF